MHGRTLLSKKDLERLLNGESIDAPIPGLPHKHEIALDLLSQGPDSPPVSTDEKQRMLSALHDKAVVITPAVQEHLDKGLSITAGGLKLMPIGPRNPTPPPDRHLQIGRKDLIRLLKGEEVAMPPISGYPNVFSRIHGALTEGERNRMLQSLSKVPMVVQLSPMDLAAILEGGPDSTLTLPMFDMQIEMNPNFGLLREGPRARAMSALIPGMRKQLLLLATYHPNKAARGEALLNRVNDFIKNAKTTETAALTPMNLGPLLLGDPADFSQFGVRVLLMMPRQAGKTAFANLLRAAAAFAAAEGLPEGQIDRLNKRAEEISPTPFVPPHAITKPAPVFPPALRRGDRVRRSGTKGSIPLGTEGEVTSADDRIVSIRWALGPSDSRAQQDYTVEPFDNRFELIQAAPLPAPVGVTSAAQAQKIAESVLEEANRIVQGARMKNYGLPSENFKRWEDLAKAAGINVTAYELSILMILGKLARAMENPFHRDNWVDIPGYSYVTAEILGALGTGRPGGEPRKV